MFIDKDNLIHLTKAVLARRSEKNMGIFVFRGRVWRNFFEVIYLLTQQTQIVSGMMILDVSDLSKTNQAIFEVIESLKSNIYALDLEEFAQKKVNFKVFT